MAYLRRGLESELGRSGETAARVAALWVLSCSVVSDSLQPWTVAHQAPLSVDFPGKNTGVGCCFLLWGIFLTQGSNLCVLHWQADSLSLSPLAIHYPLLSLRKVPGTSVAFSQIPIQSKPHSVLRTNHPVVYASIPFHRRGYTPIKTEVATHPLHSSNLKARRALGHNLILILKANV